jgi:F-type H+-transporting ATPase subunit delta
MRETTIARNYAETLLSLARKAGDLRGWGGMITDVAAAMQNDRRLRVFLESPRVDATQKSQILAKAFQDRMPRLFVRYLQALIAHRRQMLIPQISREYLDLVDAAEGRMHANVTVAREPDADTKAVVARELSRSFAKDVVPHFDVDPRILGGLVIRVGDTVFDGSVQHRLERLRSRMVGKARA